MIHLKTYESISGKIKEKSPGKFWKISKIVSTDKLYKAAVLDKIGISEDNYWYNFIMKHNEDIFVVYNNDYNIWDHWSTKFTFELYSLLDNDYKEQQLPNITKEDIENQKIKQTTNKYNI